jgi:phosphate starvation-inducible protein PhoH
LFLKLQEENQMEEESQVLSKRERREARRQSRTGRRVTPENIQDKLHFVLREVKPLTQNQKLTMDHYGSGKNLMLMGSAGTGKTFLSMYLALNEVLTGESQYKKVVIVRSVVPTRDMGFLPGNSKEKAKVYEAPYYAICTELFSRGDAYDYLKNKNLVEFISTSFIRGITLNNCVIVVDEAENLNGHELDSVITRMGKNCKIVFCGDFRQSDFIKSTDKAGILDFMKIIERMKSFNLVDFNIHDIVRSGTVKEYLIMKDNLGILT